MLCLGFFLNVVVFNLVRTRPQLPQGVSLLAGILRQTACWWHNDWLIDQLIVWHPWSDNREGRGDVFVGDRFAASHLSNSGRLGPMCFGYLSTSRRSPSPPLLQDSPGTRCLHHVWFASTQCLFTQVPPMHCITDFLQLTHHVTVCHPFCCSQACDTGHLSIKEITKKFNQC